MAVMTGGVAGTMATYTKEVWSQTATVTARPKVMLWDLCDDTWAPELGANGGDTINIPSFSQNSGAVARSSFGTAAALNTELIATTEAQVQLIVNKMAIYGFAMPKEGRLQASTAYYTQLVKGIGESLMLYRDAQVSSDNTNGFDGFSTVVGTDGVDLTEDNIITCQVNLENANADAEDRFCVLSPASFASIHVYEAFRNMQYKGAVGNLDVNKSQGFRGGPVYGFMFYESNNLEAGSSGKKNAAFQRKAIAVASQQGVEIDRQFDIPGGLIDYCVGSIVFGQKEVVDGFGNELDGK